MYYFTYKVTHPNGKYYVGRHETKDLEDGYFGSGVWVRDMKDTSVLDREILEYFDNHEDLMEGERRLIKEHIDRPNNMNFNDNPVGFSSSNNPSKCPDRRKELSVMNMGDNNPMKKGHTEETKRKISLSTRGTNNPFYGRTHTEETKEKIRQKNTGRKHSEETKRLYSEQRKGKQTWNKGTKGQFSIGKEGRDKISQSWNNRETLTCEYCNKEGLYPHLYKRWHGVNCKQRT